MLVDTLKTFYAKMGYPEVRLDPYTSHTQSLRLKSRSSGEEMVRAWRSRNIQTRSDRTFGCQTSGMCMGNGT